MAAFNADAGECREVQWARCVVQAEAEAGNSIAAADETGVDHTRACEAATAGSASARKAAAGCAECARKQSGGQGATLNTTGSTTAL